MNDNILYIDLSIVEPSLFLYGEKIKEKEIDWFQIKEVCSNLSFLNIDIETYEFLTLLISYYKKNNYEIIYIDDFNDSLVELNKNNATCKQIYSFSHWNIFNKCLQNQNIDKIWIKNGVSTDSFDINIQTFLIFNYRIENLNDFIAKTNINKIYICGSKGNVTPTLNSLYNIWKNI